MTRPPEPDYTQYWRSMRLLIGIMTALVVAALVGKAYFENLTAEFVVGLLLMVISMSAFSAILAAMYVQPK